MRLTGFVKGGVRHIGRVDGAAVADLGPVEEFYADAAAGLRAVGAASYATVDLELAPPVPVSARVFCVGVNYRSHAEETRDFAGLETPTAPLVFGRWGSTLIADGEAAPVPPGEPGLDWEVELAAVIGTECWAATRENAMEAVLGYAVFNDLSARRKQMETSQFTLGKNGDRTGPISALVTTDEAGDPAQGWRVRTLVNGTVMQDAVTSDLIHDVPAIISYITDTVTLMPGDVIATGTPGGVGAGMTPPMFLAPSDVVVVEVDGVGSVRTPIVKH